MNAIISQADSDTIDYVTLYIGEQLFGLPIHKVQDVFQLNRMTVVPLAPPEYAGVLNLRGRIVTAIDLRVRLGLPAGPSNKSPMAVGIEYGGEAFGFLIDRVGEVLKVEKNTFENNPVNLDPRWVKVSSGVHRLDGELMIVLNVDMILAQGQESAAA
jgi:purine-binding chemotaxis protein CheW